MNFFLIASGFLLLYASTFIENHTHWIKLLSIPGILVLVAGCNSRFVHGFTS